MAASDFGPATVAEYLGVSQTSADIYDNRSSVIARRAAEDPFAMTIIVASHKRERE